MLSPAPPLSFLSLSDCTICIDVVHQCAPPSTPILYPMFLHLLEVRVPQSPHLFPSFSLNPCNNIIISYPVDMHRHITNVKDGFASHIYVCFRPSPEFLLSLAAIKPQSDLRELWGHSGNPTVHLNGSAALPCPWLSQRPRRVPGAHN